MTNGKPLDGRDIKLKGANDLLPFFKFGALIGVVAVALALVPIFNFLSSYSTAWHPERSLLIFLAVTAIALFTAVVSYKNVPKYLKIIIKGLAVILGIYGLLLGSDFSYLSVEYEGGVRAFLMVTPFIVAAATIGALFRPSLAMVPALYLLIHKDMTRVLSGARELGRNDYAPLVEVLVFTAGAVTAMGLFVLAFDFVKRRYKLSAEQVGAVEEAIKLLPMVILCIAVGAHLGNYFMSGVAKIRLDGGVLAWVASNPTSSLMLAGYNVGAAPGSYAPGLFGFAYQILKAVEPYLNFVTLCAQFFCFLAFFRVRLMLGFTLFFDCMHIAIFLLTGALFVPWILLNSLLAAAFIAMKTDRLPKEAIIAGVLTTVVGHTIFYNARLGWYDSRELRDSFFTAVTDTGEEMRVPSSYFRQSSYLMYTRNFGFREHSRPSRHVPTSQWGQIGIGVKSSEMPNYKIMQETRKCEYHSPVEADETIYDYDVDRPAEFVSSYHQMMIEKQRKSGHRPGYHLYPHHHYSMPVRYKAFEGTNLENIRGYYYNVQTVCLGWKDGQFSRDVMVSTKSDFIPVK
ncbi:hypothetical protein HY29_14125 [Hyphomonas beringensis]|uniref:Uncharacterized protein n=1 Tax=Hyphomonas beringensis TaxID=1280946 RepID=A0A062U220_9PROT|nr:hypothetical protein [Hyphomonas beringensis]KCZ54391.1 hypothetical protein HY29_14125 [Hyphomonas beringensis]